MASTPIVLAIDLGTSSVRAALFDEQANIILASLTSIVHHPATTPDGGAEMDADSVLQRVERVVDGALAVGGSGSIRSVAISTYWHSMLGVDGLGRPVTPVYIWADTRAAHAIPKLRERLDTEAAYKRTGCPMHPSYFPAKLAWLKESHKRIFTRVSSWISMGEYIQLRLLGVSACGEGMASGTGVYDQRERRWDSEVLSAVEVGLDQLFPLVDSLTPIGKLRPEYWARWPVLRSANWYPAIGDGACSNLGSGAGIPSVEAINYGTSGAIRTVVERPVEFPRGLWLYRIDSRRLLLGGALSNGGNIYQWLTDTLRITPEEAETALKEATPGDSRLRFIPHLAGERSPGWSPDATGSISGLRLDTTPQEIFAAGMEGMLMDFMRVHKMLMQCDVKLTKIVAGGGAVTKSEALAQNLADALGEPIHISAYKEPSIRGAAMLALEGMGVQPENEDVKGLTGQIIEPIPERHEAYNRLLNTGYT